MKKNIRCHKTHDYFMEVALNQAKKAFLKDEVPVGTVIVNQNGIILAKAYNKVEKIGCQLAHAEALAIQKACKKINNWRLIGCSIYVTLEPCLMCLGLIHLSRLENLIFGTVSKIFGTGLLTNNVKSVHTYFKKLKILEGVKEKECKKLVKEFFINKRKQKDEQSEN